MHTAIYPPVSAAGSSDESYTHRMGTYDTERVNEVRILLDTVRQKLPNWIMFQTDYDVELKRIVHFLLTNDRSPLEWQRDGKPLYRAVIEWKTRDGGWTNRITEPPVTGRVGRVARIRFRKPREEGRSHGGSPAGRVRP